MSIPIVDLTTTDYCEHAILSLIMDRLTSSEIFSEWLLRKLESEGISMTTLAHRAGVSKQLISKYINQPPEKPDKDALRGIAHAFRMPDVEIFRIAGFLDPVPEKRSQMEKLTYLVNMLGDDDLQEVIDYARHRLEKQEGKQQTSRRGIPARTAKITS